MGIKRSRDIEKKIHTLRTTLEELVYKNNMRNLYQEEILDVSRELDILIVEYMSISF